MRRPAVVIVHVVANLSEAPESIPADRPTNIVKRHFPVVIPKFSGKGCVIADA